ncbi:LRRN4 C-terminal-like protein [Protopterus annectens]|uniref:LRRN4 C-terminal-like protein n=1 Tax=Protopterus annectens TaxID=7888 RepID=UPI001CFBAE58|nr:LRRN4 C-terminal-like protein [Protopterus annectens]
MNSRSHIALGTLLLISFGIACSVAAPVNEEGFLPLNNKDVHFTELSKVPDPKNGFSIEGSGTGFEESVKRASEDSIYKKAYVPVYSFIRIAESVTSDNDPTTNAVTAKSTLRKIQFRTIGDDYEDYDYGDDNQKSTSKPVSYQPLKPCDYDSCRHMQVPCDELRKAGSCLCPGLSGPNVRPDPPRLHTVTFSDHSASIHWCSPSSTVEKYYITYKKLLSDTEDKTPLINSTDRIYTLSGLDSSTEYVICVVATNKAGSSYTDDSLSEGGPCQAFKTPVPYLLYLYIALPIAGFILLATSMLTCYFCMKKKKTPKHSSIETISSSGGVYNPTFSNEEGGVHK